MADEGVRVGRRALLAAGAASVAAAAMNAIGAPASALAGSGDPVMLGKSNTAKAVTKLVASTGTAAFLGVGQTMGVLGTGGSGYAGVYGYAAKRGRGVDGRNTDTGSYGALGGPDTGVHAEAGRSPLALRVVGPAAFSRSGIAVVAKNASSVTIRNLSLSGSSLVLATPQTNRAGVWVQAAVPDPKTRTATIHLSKKVSAPTRIAWFVVN